MNTTTRVWHVTWSKMAVDWHHLGWISWVHVTMVIKTIWWRRAKAHRRIVHFRLDMETLLWKLLPWRRIKRCRRKCWWRTNQGSKRSNKCLWNAGISDTSQTARKWSFQAPGHWFQALKPLVKLSRNSFQVRMHSFQEWRNSFQALKLSFQAWTRKFPCYSTCRVLSPMT